MVRSPDGTLVELAAGTVYTGGGKWPRAFLSTEVDLAEGDAHVRFFRYSDSGRGFWNKDSLAYENAPDFSLEWVVEASRRHCPEPDCDYAALDTSALQQVMKAGNLEEARRHFSSALSRIAAEAIVADATTVAASNDQRLAYVHRRVQNAWLLEVWYAIDGLLPETPQPDQLALYLGLGFTQATTTWQWPATERWIALLGGEPPEHWLPRSQWHLCWRLHDPEDDVHRRGLAEALDEADLIWRVRHGPGEGDWFYVFVLLELQSTVQRFMALRLLVYVLHLCEALILHKGYLAAHRPRRLLPPVLAVVLYNGEKPWTAPLSLAELFKPMEGYTPPDFKYVVLDVNRYSPEELRPVEDVVSGVFLLEQSGDVEELRAVIDDLEELIDDPELARDVASLVSDVALKLNLGEEEIPQVKTLEEVRMSLLQRAEKWTQQWKAEGKAETLKNLAHRRFGKLPAWAVDRVDRADMDTLDRWSYRILDATVLEDVFKDTK